MSISGTSLSTRATDAWRPLMMCLSPSSRLLAQRHAQRELQRVVNAVEILHITEPQ